MITDPLLALCAGGFMLLAFVALAGYGVFMAWTMVRDGWRSAWRSSARGSTALARPGVWPPPPEAGYVCGGHEYKRILYGQETDVQGASSTPCLDCDAVSGGLHGHGCVVEQCPVCGGSVTACDCEYDRFTNHNAPTALIAPKIYVTQVTRWGMTWGALGGLFALLLNAGHNRWYFYLFLFTTLYNTWAAIGLWREHLRIRRATCDEEAPPR